MKCPICDLDLSPLDLQSRAEHVDLCIENGPSTVEVNNETGQLVIKKSIAPGKERKICPICDKTFQNLTSHFQTCALKYDVPPDLMLDHWERINKNVKNPKKFPRKLLDGFVAKCVKEGRLGDQVDFARALSLSMSQDEGNTNDSIESTHFHSNSTTQASEDSVTRIEQQLADNSRKITADVNQILMQNASALGKAQSTSGQQTTSRQRFRIELADEITKQRNITLRIDRELAATRSQRYHEALRAAAKNQQDDDDCCVILDDDENEVEVIEDENELNKLFHRARLKRCNEDESCRKGECKNHDLVLLMEEFEPYAGPPMDAAPTKADLIGRAHAVKEGREMSESVNEQATCSSSGVEPLEATELT